jgi:hypothetical protein
MTGNPSAINMDALPESSRIIFEGTEGCIALFQFRLAIVQDIGKVTISSNRQVRSPDRLPFFEHEVPLEAFQTLWSSLQVLKPLDLVEVYQVVSLSTNNVNSTISFEYTTHGRSFKKIIQLSGTFFGDDRMQQFHDALLSFEEAQLQVALKKKGAQ